MPAGLNPATRRIRSGAAGLAPALLATMAISAAPGIAGAQQVIELPGEDRWLEADFEEVYRVGSVDGEPWEEFGTVAKVGFDGAGNLHVFDSPCGTGPRCGSGRRVGARVRPEGRGAG